jgi:hypothetical protein
VADAAGLDAEAVQAKAQGLQFQMMSATWVVDWRRQTDPTPEPSPVVTTGLCVDPVHRPLPSPEFFWLFVVELPSQKQEPQLGAGPHMDMCKNGAAVGAVSGVVTSAVLDLIHPVRRWSFVPGHARL